MELSLKNEKAFWNSLEAVARSYMYAAGLRGDDAEDCVRDFVLIVLEQPGDPFRDALESGGAEKLICLIKEYAAIYRGETRRRCARLVSMDAYHAESGRGYSCNCLRHTMREFSGRNRPPEAMMMHIELLDRLFSAVVGLPPDKQRLWARYVEDGVKLVDLQDEFGKSAAALWKSISRIRDAVRKKLESDGLTAAEIAEYRREFACFDSILESIR